MSYVNLSVQLCQSYNKIGKTGLYKGPKCKVVVNAEGSLKAYLEEWFLENAYFECGEVACLDGVNNNFDFFENTMVDFEEKHTQACVYTCNTVSKDHGDTFETLTTYPVRWQRIVFENGGLKCVL